jgi:hypothetical protein
MVNNYDSTFTQSVNKDIKQYEEHLQLEVKLDVMKNILAFSKSLEVLKSEKTQDIFIIKN